MRPPSTGSVAPEDEGHPAARVLAPALGVLDWAVTVAEVLVAAGLAFVAAWAVVELLIDLGGTLLGKAPPIDFAHPSLDKVMTFFIIVELFRIAVAYIKHDEVLHTVLEAGIVAVARKIVLYDFTAYGLPGAAAYAVMLAVLMAGYVFLIRGMRRARSAA